MGLFDTVFGGGADVSLPEIPTTKVDDMSKDAIYMVGINEDGFTQLKVGYPTSVTLTLNPEAVALLIKQLAVSIDEEYTVKVSRITYEDEE